jgi:hypothetical protein
MTFDELTLPEQHVLRKLRSLGHENCVPCAQYPEPVLKSLAEKGFMDPINKIEGGVSCYRLTIAGREVTLRYLR